MLISCKFLPNLELCLGYCQPTAYLPPSRPRSYLSPAGSGRQTSWRVSRHGAPRRPSSSGRRCVGSDPVLSDCPGGKRVRRGVRYECLQWSIGKNRRINPDAFAVLAENLPESNKIQHHAVRLPLNCWNNQTQ